MCLRFKGENLECFI